MFRRLEPQCPKLWCHLKTGCWWGLVSLRMGTPLALSAHSQLLCPALSRRVLCWIEHNRSDRRSALSRGSHGHLSICRKRALVLSWVAHTRRHLLPHDEAALRGGPCDKTLGLMQGHIRCRHMTHSSLLRDSDRGTQLSHRPQHHEINRELLF